MRTTFVPHSRLLIGTLCVIFCLMIMGFLSLETIGCDLVDVNEKQTDTIMPLQHLLDAPPCQCKANRRENNPITSVNLQTPYKPAGEIINPYTFSTLVVPSPGVTVDKLFLMVYVHSAVGRPHLRDRIRRTWGRSENYPWLNKRVKTVFILGKPDAELDKITMADIMEEHKKHGDLVMADFDDHYDNMTYKHRTFLKYASETKANAQIIIKADDDMFINIFRVIDMLDSYGGCLFGTQNKRIMCRTWTTGPHRKQSGDKFYVSRDEYPNDLYPNFCAGAVYITTPEVVRDLHLASFYTKHFRFDDVYVTGMLRDHIGAKLISSTAQYRLFDIKYTPNNEQLLEYNFLHSLSDSKYDYLWSIHMAASERGKLIVGYL